MRGHHTIPVFSATQHFACKPQSQILLLDKSSCLLFILYGLWKTRLFRNLTNDYMISKGNWWHWMEAWTACYDSYAYI